MKPVKIWTPDVDEASIVQLSNTARMPFVDPWVAAMPDVHLGMGATIGSVVPTKGAIIPAAVGVDIGCGMMAVKTDVRPDDIPLVKLRSAIEARVPVGFNRHAKLNPLQDAIAEGLVDEFCKLEQDHESFRAVSEHKNRVTLAHQIGTLGGGNHFIEICLDENDDVWIMLHSGSRGIGNKIGMHFIGLAKQDMERHFIHLPDKDLAYLPEGTEHFDAYWAAVQWAQEYASVNRVVMMHSIHAAFHDIGLVIGGLAEKAINCHHNYVAREHHYGENLMVTRKGAIRARAGDMGIIPGSMGTRSYIVEGLGNPESFDSCSHGAGRRMSRTQARKTFTSEDLVAQTEGVECRKDKGVLDEIPGAYKDIDEVMENQTDLVKVKHTLKQIICVKG
jgi:tRNA-splicing ligase RtcB